MLRLLLCTVLGLASTAWADDRPNIVWLSVEDMSPWLGCYGDDTVPTPNIDALAARGTLYTSAFATTPVCAPARSTLITGQYATGTGALHMRNGNPSRAGLARDPNAYDDIPNYEAVPEQNVQCFPEILRAAGYWCTNNAKQDYQFKVPLTVWDESGRTAHWKHRARADQPFFAVFNHVGTHESGTFSGTKRKPQVVAPADVDVPPYYPDTQSVRRDMARTYDNIAAMDAWVGRKIAELEAAGELNDTIVIFFSDHGVGLPRGKRCVYDSGTRVPLIVVHPTPGSDAAVSNRVVSFIDFAPTMMSLAGLEPSKWAEGKAFDGAFAEAGTGLAFMHADRMDSVLDRTRSVSDGRFRYIRNFMPERPRLYFTAYADNIPMMADIRALDGSKEGTAEQWQMVNATKPAEEFYDSRRDPHEVVNLIDNIEHAERIGSMRTALGDWMERTRDMGGISESELVRTRIWPPDGVQPTTTSPRARTDSFGSRLVSATPGASVGWRPLGSEAWQVFVGPIQLDEGIRIEAFAHRIGFKPSPIVELP